MGRRGTNDAPEMGNFEQEEVNLDIIMEDNQKVEVAPQYEEHPQTVGMRTLRENKEIVNCLRNEIVIVRKLPKRTNLVKESNHIMGDGMHENAFRTFSVPKLQKSNNFVNVLTNQEKECLEMAMGLEPNALSIYRQPAESNFWSNANPTGLSMVKLTKRDNIFDLSKPTDFISYKILLANKDKICPSMEAYAAAPKETYEYVIIREGEENKNAQNATDATINAFMKLGKISEDRDVLKLVVETMMGKKYSDNVSVEWLQTQASDLIKSGVKNARLFLNIVNDDLLDVKVLIRKSIAKGFIADRGGYLYIKDTNTPMCSDGQNPTADVAARWLSLPRNQEVLFSLQAKVKQD